MFSISAKNNFNTLRIIQFVTALFLFVAVDSAFAALKIGYVNVVKVIEKAPQGELALKRLDAEFAPRDKKLLKMREQIKSLETDLDKDSLVLQSQDREKKERDLLVLKRDLRRSTQEFREDYNLRRNEELAALQKLVYKTIIDLAKKEGYDLIVHEGAVYSILLTKCCRF